MEPTTTGAAPTDGVVPTTQPVEGAQPTAAQPPEPQQSPSQPAQANDEYAAWLATKSIDPSDPEAFSKVAQMAFNSEKLMTKATMEASELKRSLTPQQPQGQQSNVDPALAAIGDFAQEYKTDKMLNQFKESHKDWMDYRQQMSQALSQQVNTPYGVFSREQLVNEGILSLDDIYTMAKGSTPVDTTQIQQQTRTEVLQTLANTQRAGGGAAHASNPNPQSTNEDPITAAIRKSRG